MRDEQLIPRRTPQSRAVTSSSATACSATRHQPLADRIWALRENLTAYDAAFVALAEALQVPLITGDARLARAPGVDVEVYPRRVTPR